MPYLRDGSADDKRNYLNLLQKASMEDARFQNIFPFTDWNTMEIRVMDAQLFYLPPYRFSDAHSDVVL